MDNKTLREFKLEEEEMHVLNVHNVGDKEYEKTLSYMDIKKMSVSKTQRSHAQRPFGHTQTRYQ